MCCSLKRSHIKHIIFKLSETCDLFMFWEFPAILPIIPSLLSLKGARLPFHTFAQSIPAAVVRCNLAINHMDLWAALDRNNDGLVTLEEWSAQRPLCILSERVVW